jgi:uncharacterized C2H2 Zn-finger protein
MKRWWRVELSDGGRLQSVCEAEQSENGNRTYYVQADTEDAAAKKARRLYKLEQRIWREEERRTKGWCIACGCPRDDEQFARCSRCREIAKNAVDRFRARGGKKIGRPKRAEPKMRAARRAVLTEVHQAWLSAADYQAFADWLLAAIHELEPESSERDRGAA